MLRAELIELVNRGGVWAFVGSGTSIGSGAPSWLRLTQLCAERLFRDQGVDASRDRLYAEALEKEDFPESFSRLEAMTTRQALESAVRSIMQGARDPTRALRTLVTMPFAGFVTTNYDLLLERALMLEGLGGWATVGNSSTEIPKLSRDPENVVWHIHGALDAASERSRLVLTSEDYDDVYQDSSEVVFQLKALLTQRRVVFVGFGLRDVEFLRLLRQVKRFSNPARPILAFLSGVYGGDKEPDRVRLLERYNVDAIPYPTTGESHKALDDLIEVYGSLVLRRNLRFGRESIDVPSFHPETTGLLVYNELCLRVGAPRPDTVLGMLIRARILSLLAQGYATTDSMKADLLERAKLIGRSHTEEEAARLIENVIGLLQREGLVEAPHDGAWKLTETAAALVRDQAATSERMADQFADSLRIRAKQAIEEEGASGNVAAAAEAFFRDCVERRALGVALAMESLRQDFQQYHMVALLQHAKDFMPQLTKPAEAVALTRVILAVLAKPTEIEHRYLALSLQARFGIHLLGFDPDTLRVRAEDFANTTFLLDSSSLIPLTARSSSGHPAAALLLTKLKALGSRLATSFLLADEGAEHARWAISKVASGIPDLRTLAAATGRAGERSNAFLEGFLNELGRATVRNMDEYLAACGLARGVRTDEYISALERLGVTTRKFEEWPGFEESFFHERDELAERIKTRREQRQTFRRFRQVTAEAEALLIIRTLRAGAMGRKDAPSTGAFFVSHTRVIDEIANVGLPITMLPQAVLQLCATLTACSVDELASLTNGLFWEMSERDLNVVDRSSLQTTFAGLISPSQDRLEDELARHRALVAAQYGEEGVKAFEEVDQLDIPMVVESYFAQKSEVLEEELTQARRASELVAQKVQKLESEKAALGRDKQAERERREKKHRIRQALERKRAKEATQSNAPAKRRRKKKKKK